MKFPKYDSVLLQRLMLMFFFTFYSLFSHTTEDEQSTIFNLPQVPKDSPIKAATPSVGVNTKKTSRRVMETTS